MEDPSLFLNAKHVKKQIKIGENVIDILQDINLQIKLGESVALLGASGSGKTTLLTLLAGLDLPTAGHIVLANEPMSELNEEQRAVLRGKYVGFIFQNFQLLPTLTALENAMLPLDIQLFPYHEACDRAKEWLDKVGLSQRFNHYPAMLSGGEQQRVAIARAFVTKPKIIFADEMTGNLDSKTGHLIADLIFSLNEKYKTTLVLATHDNELASRCGVRYQLIDGMLKANHAIDPTI